MDSTRIVPPLKPVRSMLSGKSTRSCRPGSPRTITSPAKARALIAVTEPLAIHPFVRAQVYALGALGTVGVRGLFRHSCLWGDCCTDFWADAEAPFPKGVRFLSVYSRSDGVVRWRSCLDPHAEHLEIRASHLGMGMHPRAWRAVAEELERLRKSEARRQAAHKARRRRRAAARQARVRRAA